jgi:hypothetical protein
MSPNSKPVTHSSVGRQPEPAGTGVTQLQSIAVARWLKSPDPAHSLTILRRADQQERDIKEDHRLRLQERVDLLEYILPRIGK